MQKKCLSGSGMRLTGGEDRCGSRTGRILIGQVTDKERSTNVHVTDV